MHGEGTMTQKITLPQTCAVPCHYPSNPWHITLKIRTGSRQRRQIHRPFMRQRCIAYIEIPPNAC